MADNIVKAGYLKAIDEDTNTEVLTQFIPPIPSNGDLGGISEEQLKQITKNQNELVYQDEYIDCTEQYVTKKGIYNRKTGAYIANDYASATDLISVNEGDIFAISCSYAFDNCGIAEFDDSGVFKASKLAQTDDTASTYTKAIDYIYTVPSGVAKVGFSSYPAGISTNANRQALLIKKVKTLKEQVTINTDDLKEIRKSWLYGKTLYIDGDSIARGVGANNKGYGELLAEKYNMTVSNHAEDGGCIGNVSGKHCAADSVVTNYNGEDIVILDGGFNDCGSSVSMGKLSDDVTKPYTENPTSVTFIGGMELAFQHIISINPSAKIFFLIPHKILRSFTINRGTLGYTFQHYVNAIKMVCERYGVEVLNIFEDVTMLTYIDVFKQYTYKQDGIHPTLEGYNKYYMPYIERKVA